jgi:hypothetical protein
MTGILAVVTLTGKLIVLEVDRTAPILVHDPTNNALNKIIIGIIDTIKMTTTIQNI